MLGRDELIAEILPATPRVGRPLVGYEVEMFCLDRQTLSPIPYQGERGFGAILKALAQQSGGKLADESPINKLTLPNGATISLEPGGQLEFSSAPQGTFRACLDQWRNHWQLLTDLKRAFDLHYFFGGVTPVHSLDDIGLVVPNQRYRLMNDYFPTVGTMGRRMMRQTASVQITFDFSTPELGEQLLRAAHLAAPLIAALFANSPYLEGKKTGHRSTRALIWRHTDPARSGAIPGFTRPDFSFGDYVDHIVKAPLFFIEETVAETRQLTPAQGMTFDQFNRQGRNGHFPTRHDFSLHNSTIFTDIRARRTIEVRTVDCIDPAIFPGLLALVAGLLLCETARRATLQLLAGSSVEDYATLPTLLAEEGLHARWRGKPLTHLLRELVEHASTGLSNCFSDGGDARAFLLPLTQTIDAAQTPADLVVKRFGDNAHDWLAAGQLQSADWI